MVLKIVRTVWPVMLTYVAIGAPCGMIMAQTGMEPWMVLALSSTFVTGSGQFMVCNLWLAGVPAASIVASVAAISSRFALYIGVAPRRRISFHPNLSNFLPSWSISSGTMVKLYCSKA